MVIAVNVGHIWELPRLSWLRWHILVPCLDARWGRRGSPRDANFVVPTHLLRREVVGEGALRGRSPRTREAACGRPPGTAVVRGQWLAKTAGDGGMTGDGKKSIFGKLGHDRD